MTDIKQYLEETNTVLLTKEAFERLKERACVLDKISAEIIAISINGQVDDHTMFIRTGEQVKQMVLEIIDKYNEKSEDNHE